MADRKIKPMGPIPPGFPSDDDGMLLIGGERADMLVARAGDTPLFVYDLALARRTIATLRSAMPADLSVHFAIKANSHRDVLNAMQPLVDGFDVASGGELAMALAAGMAADRISFAGPGKRDDELEATIRAGATLNVESEGEVARSIAIGRRIHVQPRIAVRINPDFDLKGSGMRMGGGAKPFGVDAARVPALVRRLIDDGADWRGFHIFAGSQALDAAAIINTQAQTVALAAALADAVGVMPPTVNLGGGFGVPYFSGDQPLDIAAVGRALAAQIVQRPAILRDTHFAIELGRYLIAECGVYLTRIVDRKLSHGETFLIVDGGLHHQLAASGNFGTVIRRNYPLCVASRMRTDADDVVNVVGCLCTPIDRLGEAVALPRADVGDLIAIFLAGAYGASASPAAFLGHPAARELIVNTA